MFDFVADVATGGLYGAVTGKGFDITGKGAAANANKAAISAQKEMAGASNQTIRDMYNTGRTDQLPFITPSLSALPYYQSAILGGPVQYQDPNYQRLTSFDPEYKAGSTQYRAPDGSIVDAAPMLSAEYNPQESPGYQWQLQQGQKQLDRTLRSLGRSNSTYGMQQQGNFIQNLNANEYDKGINRLATLAGFGQGTNANVAGSGNQAAGQIAGVNTSTANSLGNLYSQLGSLYTDYSPLNLGLNAAKVGAAFLK